MKSQSVILGILLLLGWSFFSFAEAEMKLRNRIRIQKKTHMVRSSIDEDTENISAEKQQVLSVKRKNLIQDIRRFIRESHSQDQIAELNLRLGGLYLEEYRAENAKAQNEYDKATQAFQKTKRIKGMKTPQFDNSEAIANLERARAIYRDLANRFPKHPRRDEMLYFLALSSMDRGKNAEGIATFERLAKEYPSSRYVNDAVVQVADHYFDNNNFKVAEGYYDRIVAKKYKPLLPYAIYKKGWCAYNGGQPQKALQAFQWVISNEINTEGSGTTVRVRQEALRDITLPFVDLKMVNESIEFFRAQGDPYQRQGLETMASLYFEQGNYPQSIQMNEELLSLDANYSKNPSYDLSIVEGLRMRNERPKAFARLFEKLPLYLQNSNWYEINATKPEVVKAASDQYEEAARKYALEIHAEGQKTKNEQLYDSARVLYSKYLEFFPNTVHSPTVRFYLAEIQYRQKQWLASADNYYQVFKTSGSTGAMKLESIQSTLSALAHQMKEDRSKQGLSELNTKGTTKLKENEDAVLEPQPLSPVETKFVTASNDYLENYPKSKDAAQVLYEESYLFYLHYDFVPAYKSFWKLTQGYPGTPTAYSASYLILDILNRRKEYGKMVLACRKFLDTKAFSQSGFRTEIANILRHSELKRIAQLEEKGQNKEAGDAYVEYTQNYGPQDEALFEKALYNASVNYTKAGALMTAVDTQEKFLRRFPKSSYRENMLLQVAKTYESLAMLDKAAFYFAEFSSEYPNRPQTKGAWRLAGLYYWGSGNAAKAESLMKGYVKAFPADTKMVEGDIEDFYSATGAYDKLIQYYLEARAARGIPLSQYLYYTVRIGELQARDSGKIPSRTMEEALKVVQKFQKDLSTSPRGVENMGKTLFWFANQKEDVFYRIKLALPQKQLEINLQRKMALLKELEKEYSRISAVGGEWGLGAIYKTAALYQLMTKDIAQAPVPSELTAEQIELYRAEIEKQMIKPFREKALALSTQCLDKAQEFNLLSNWTAKCYSLANELEPNRYPMVRTFFLPPHQVAVLVPKETEGKTVVGDYKNYRYPYASSTLFQNGSDRQLASVTSIPSLYSGQGIRFDDASRAVPHPITYLPLSDERKKIVENSIQGERGNRKATFNYLHLMRLQNPNRAIVSIQEAIRNDPNNASLHNLLGLAYMDSGNYSAAKVTWLSMIARDLKHSPVWNNLGVLEAIEGDEQAAMAYFHQATEMESKEALTNLGFLALKYRNGAEGKRLFERALVMDKSLVTAQVGIGIAKIQNREFDAAKSSLLDSREQFKNDPLTQLSLAYFLMDSEKENEDAQKYLVEYMHQQGLDNDRQFREALQETQGKAITSEGGLPGIE